MQNQTNPEEKSKAFKNRKASYKLQTPLFDPIRSVPDPWLERQGGVSYCCCYSSSCCWNDHCCYSYNSRPELDPWCWPRDQNQLELIPEPARLETETGQTRNQSKLDWKSRLDWRLEPARPEIKRKQL